jgi:hypothetical protein
LLRQFGVQLSVARPGEFTDGKQEVPTPDELDSHNAQDDLRAIVDGMSELPTQYVGFSGLKHIVLVSYTGKDPNTPYAATAYTDGKHNTITVNVATDDSEPSTIDHEIYHLVDAAECGSDGMSSDQGYTKLNGNNANIYTGKDDNNDNNGNLAYDGNTVNNDYDRLSNLEGSSANKHTAIYNQLYLSDQDELATDLSRVDVYTEYSLRNEVEDKAELGRNIAFPEDYDEVLEPGMPKLRSKFEFLLARLYKYRPDVVKYLAAVSTRPKDYSVHAGK